jgi:hypothetical protein
VDNLGFYRMTVDKGDQSAGGKNAEVLGNIAGSSTACASDGLFQLKVLESRRRGITVKAAADGTLWLLIGTDSGFESTTRLFYTRVEVFLERA